MYCIRRFWKKTIGVLGVVLLLALSARSNITTSKSLTFNLETGDQIEVEVDTSDGYDLRNEGTTFYVVKDGETALQGIFYTAEQSDAQAELIRTTEGVTVVKDEDGFLSYDFPGGAAGPEVGYLVAIPDTTLSYYAASLKDQAAADDAIKHLTVKKAE